MRNSNLRFALVMLSTAMLAGCIHMAPISRTGDRGEAMAFARQLLTLAPEAKALLHDEQLTANDMRVMLDESTGQEFSAYRDKFDALVQRFVAIRNSRQTIQTKIRQGVWKGTLAHLIQQNAIDEIQENLDRTTTWIQLAHNFRLRADFGREKNFPEMSILDQTLDAFLSENQDEPMSFQVAALQSEYRFKQSDLGP